MNSRTHFSTAKQRHNHDARYQNRLVIAITLSLLTHAFVLSLQFGLPGLGLPGLELPWNQRRAKLAGLSVVLSNTKRTPEAANETAAQVEPNSASPQMPMPEQTELSQPPAFSAPASAQPAPTDMQGKKPLVAVPGTRIDVARPDQTPVASSFPKRRQPVPAGSGPRLMTQDDMGQNTFSVPLPVLDEPDQAIASNASSHPELVRPDPTDVPVPAELPMPEQNQLREEEEAAQRAREAEARAQEVLQQAQELEARKQAEALAALARQRREDEENARRVQELEAQRREEQRLQDEARAARLAQELAERKQAEVAAQQQAAALVRQQAEQRRLEEENTRRVQEREAKKRAELKLQEEAKAQREALEQEARRQEQEAALRQKQAEELAAKERAGARRQEQAAAARQREQALTDKGRATGTADMIRNATNGSLAARALEQARKADNVQNIPPLSPQLPQATDPARRRSVLGRVDQDVGLMMYVDSWRLKIERNGRLNYKQSLVDTAYTEPVVTVAVRSDGSIEEIIFHRSSGRPELDEAVRRIIRLNARYAAFPPELARRFDVIEIRRTWNFDDKLRLLEEVR